MAARSQENHPIEKRAANIKGARQVGIMYGINDSFIDVWQNENDPSPRIPLEEYEANLRLIVRTLRQNNIKPVLMTSIPLGHFWVADRGIYKSNDENFKLKEYAAVVRRVADAEKVPLVDHFKTWLECREKGQDIGAWMTDGMHPNPRGHRFMAATIFKVLQGELLRTGQRKLL